MTAAICGKKLKDTGDAYGVSRRLDAGVDPNNAVRLVSVPSVHVISCPTEDAKFAEFQKTLRKVGAPQQPALIGDDKD